MPLLSIWGHRGRAGPVHSMNGDPEDWGWSAPSWEPLWGPGLQKGRKDAIHREAGFLCFPGFRRRAVSALFGPVT